MTDSEPIVGVLPDLQSDAVQVLPADGAIEPTSNRSGLGRLGLGLIVEKHRGRIEPGGRLRSGTSLVSTPPAVLASPTR